MQQKMIPLMDSGDFAMCDVWDCTRHAVAFEETNPGPEVETKYFCRWHCEESLPCSVHYEHFKLEAKTV